ncbi:MAG: single-stranded-DNA-specific exonuclease RecJ [Clostridiales bacterium]|jgi:single-stranded-DNA-specific exonuclease|nr:single-stranded-DNA-specific exonuclease RecJ [Clostridiales bacterium]
MIKYTEIRKDNDHAAHALSKATGLSPRFCGMLIDRGADTPEKVKAFLNPDTEFLSNPFEIAGMSAAAARLSRAVEKGERVVIYGDYDCDGICSIAMLTLCFRDELPSLKFFIPDRNTDGYGMSLGLLKNIVEKLKPSLIVTVDTGITAVSETEYLKSVGVDVIITDHHEPHGVLPDAIIVNPKIERKGFFEYCGAGVVFKLIEAVKGREKALEYIDLAAIATVADIVPLSGENRVLAAAGLKAINKRPRKGIEMLLNGGSQSGAAAASKAAKAIDAHDLAFRIAPRLNAAGRIDRAAKAVDLFLSDDHFLLSCLADELCADNKERQERCESIINDAMDMLMEKGVADRSIIILFNTEWDAGVIGIAAARLAEEFSRPAILFANGGNGILKGSARSVKAVNIFRLLSEFASLFEGFGGHSQAAGLTIAAENLPRFEKEADAYLKSLNLKREDVVCDAELKPSEVTAEFAREIELLEPTGYGNRKPRLFIRSDGLKFDRIGVTNHIKYREKEFELVGFNRAGEETALSGKCIIEFSLIRSVFRNDVYAQGTIKAVIPEPTDAGYDLTRAYVKAFSFDGGGTDEVRLETPNDDAGAENAPCGETEKTPAQPVLSAAEKVIVTEDIYGEIKKRARPVNGNLYVAFSDSP